MKNHIIYKITTLFIFLLTFNSCYNLDQYPPDSVSADNFWKTDQQAKEGVMGVYAQMKASGAFGEYFLLDCLSDIAWGYDYAYEKVLRGLYNDRDADIVRKWQDNYQGIMLANNAISNINTSKTISSKIKKETLAEAHFLRAIYYFNLLNMFGGVPIYDETTDVAKEFNYMTKPRSTAEELRKFIISDLDKASNDLPVKWNEDNSGRATKYAAIALRGRVYLYAKEYQKAAKDFNAVVNSGLYELYFDYAQLFYTDADMCNEMIFSIQNSGGVERNFGMPLAWRLGSKSTYGWCWNNSMPTNELVAMYEMKDGRKFHWDDFFPGFMTDDNIKKGVFVAKLSKDKKQVEKYPAKLNELKTMYQNRDPRMIQTILLPYTKYLARLDNECEFVVATGVLTDNGFVESNRYSGVYLWRKFVPKGTMDGIRPARADTPINFPLIRYADVLLMLAECENELGNQAKAVEYINQVRQRASTNMPKLNSGPAWLKAVTKDEVFERIVHERAVELAGEGLRYFDLKRWKIMGELNGRNIIRFIGGPRIFTRSFTNKDYLWPIPAAEQDIYHLEQNPGW